MARVPYEKLKNNIVFHKGIWYNMYAKRKAEKELITK